MAQRDPKKKTEQQTNRTPGSIFHHHFIRVNLGAREKKLLAPSSFSDLRLMVRSLSNKNGHGTSPARSDNLLLWFINFRTPEKKIITLAKIMMIGRFAGRANEAITGILRRLSRWSQPINGEWAGGGAVGTKTNLVAIISSVTRQMQKSF